MSKIYTDSSEELYKLLNRASDSNGATLLIPDLQRPYVWAPNQVVLLLDSLIRGWPFGTLLLWDVHQSDLSKIPSRSFWRTVDRTDGAEGTTVTKKDPPASYNMVLDGQQRVQSLLLALGGDSWGFRLSDKDWHAEVSTRSVRSSGSAKHWSHGTLCVDIDLMATEFARAKNVLGVDFTKVLCWVITDPANGKSSTKRTSKYEEPLPSSFAEQNKGRYVRLSRLWEKAPPKEGLEQEQYDSQLNPILQEHELSIERADKVRRSLRSLMTAFTRVKIAKVNYLRVERFDEANQTVEEYTDAVVGIFTRLNTAGRTLSREEITFAWLKVGWSREKTGGIGASECFTRLLEELSAEDLKDAVVLDDLVAGVSFAWAVVKRGGLLLSDRDLLKKDIIQPMADTLSADWSHIEESFLQVAKLLSTRRVAFRDHYQSLNALWIICTWRYLAALAEVRLSNATEPERSNFREAVARTLEKYIDQWFFCSSWAGRWSKASGQIVAGYASRLAELFRKLTEESKRLDDCAVWLELFLDEETKAFAPDALTELQNLRAEAREQVRSYYTFLWVWHRLDAERWEQSKTPLKERTKRKRTSIEVDHVVSVGMWNGLGDGTEPREGTDEPLAAPGAEIHGLGNMLLLEKSFNISKGTQPLKDFIVQLHEFRDNTENLNRWMAALKLDGSVVRLEDVDKAKLAKEFKVREESMKADLANFIRGNLRRYDV